MNDFVEGKCTLPYIYLYHALEDVEKEKLFALHARKIGQEETLWIKEKMAEHKCVEKSFALALQLSEEAKKAVSEDVELIAILDTMIKRSY
jgi:octaprenyl-diphosphate synthase